MTSGRRLDPSRPVAGRLRRASRPEREDFHTPVRGYPFAAVPPGVVPPSSGTPAALRREPDNPRDGYAVAVWVTDGTPWRIGYLDRAVAARLAPRLDAGERFQATTAGWVPAPGDGHRRPLVRITATERVRPGRDEVADVGLWGRPPASTRRVVRPRR